jgi:radical SAM superfamily enzyme YgiQ (UPF0313 family)
MNVLLLNGPSQDACDRFFGWPTSLLYAIAPSVEEHRRGTLKVDFVSEIFDPVWYVEEQNGVGVTRAFVESLEGVDIICASATYDALYPTLRLFSEAKRLNPEIVTILGGPHFDEVHGLRRFNDVHGHSEIVDYGIAGDGEYALLALLKALSQRSLSDLCLETIQGRSWIYTRDSVLPTSGRTLELNTLPFMPVELANMKRHQHDFDVFSDEFGDILPTVQMIAQRGCGYQCSFCSERRSLAHPNARSIDNILAEIDLRKLQGFKAVFFDDSTFGLYPQLTELLAELQRTGMVFGCLNRFNHLTDADLVRRYQEAGFVYFYCSVEQFSDDALRQMRKGQNTERIRQAMKNIHDHGIALGVSLLHGLPYETEDSIQATLDFTAKWVEAGVIRLVSESVFSLHPGTPDGKTLVSGFDCPPPHRGYPFDRFEEGQWYHAPHVTPDYLHKICVLSEQRFGHAMVRNRHSWYRQTGIVKAHDSLDYPHLLPPREISHGRTFPAPTDKEPAEACVTD